MLKHTLSTHCCERDCCSPQFPKEMLELPDLNSDGGDDAFEKRGGI